MFNPLGIMSVVRSTEAVNDFLRIYFVPYILGYNDRREQ